MAAAARGEIDVILVFQTFRWLTACITGILSPLGGCPARARGARGPRCWYLLDGC
jgi:hypothetical protein